MGAAAVQMLVLALPTLGICYTLFSLARRLAMAAWNWSRPSPPRRVLGALGTLAVVGLVASLWAPQLPFGLGRPGPFYDQSTFLPLTRQERGTLSDAIGAPQPVGLPDRRRGVEPTPEPSPTAEAAPAAEPTPDVALTPTPAPPTVAPTAVATNPPTSVPARAPAPPAPAAPTAESSPEPAVAPTTAPTPAPTVAPTAAPTRAPVGTPIRTPVR
jgi:hypothetical protein